MTWLTWRQHRIEMLIAATVLVVMLGLLVSTGLELAAKAAVLGQQLSVKDYRPIPLTALNLLPLILGIFVGAPYLEQGTHRLAWTQGVAPLQWLRAKFVLLGVATAAAFGVLMVVLSWWNQPVNGTLGPGHIISIQHG